MMRILTGVVSVILPAIALAQNYPGMNPDDMQNMMQQMQKMQACMQEVDQSRLKEFEQQGQAVEREVKALCSAGKRDEAQDKAMEFGRQVATDPDMQKIMECGKMMSSAMPKMPYMEQASEPDASSSHVCDQ
jgi:hypothetical protein